MARINYHEGPLWGSIQITGRHSQRGGGHLKGSLKPIEGSACTWITFYHDMLIAYLELKLSVLSLKWLFVATMPPGPHIWIY